MRTAGFRAALIAVMLVIFSLPSAWAVQPVVHPQYTVCQAYISQDKPLTRFRGNLGTTYALVGVFPGYFDIDPGTSWADFVTASGARVGYSVKNVTLRKQPATFVQCSEAFSTSPVVQEGTPNIRLRWPTLYETPGTVWTLTILYGTSSIWDDDGPGPNPPSFVHTEVWSWKVDVTWQSFAALVETFHELPWGTSEVPLISDETLYTSLLTRWSTLYGLVSANRRSQAALAAADLELLIMDSCITTMPATPAPSGLGTGIAQSDENPACCKLLVDLEYTIQKYSLITPRPG